MADLSLDEMLKLAEQVKEWSFNPPTKEYYWRDYVAKIDLNPEAKDPSSVIKVVVYRSHYEGREIIWGIEVQNHKDARLGLFEAKKIRKILSGRITTEPGLDKLQAAYNRAVEAYKKDAETSTSEVRRYLGAGND